MSIQPPVTPSPSPIPFVSTTVSPLPLPTDSQPSFPTYASTSSSLSSQISPTETQNASSSTSSSVSIIPKSGPPIALIVGVIAGVLAIFIGGIIVWCILRRRKRRNSININTHIDIEHNDKEGEESVVVQPSIKPLRLGAGGRREESLSFESSHREQQQQQQQQRSRSSNDHDPHDNYYANESNGHNHNNNHQSYQRQQRKSHESSERNGMTVDDGCYDLSTISPTPTHSNIHNTHKHHFNKPTQHATNLSTIIEIPAHSNDSVSVPTATRIVPTPTCIITVPTPSSSSLPASSSSSSSVPVATVPPPAPSKDPKESSPSSPRSPTTAATPFLQSTASQEIPLDVHIDMIDMDLETLIPILISDEIQFPPRTSSSATSRTASPPSTPRPAKIKPLSIPTAPVPPSPTSKPVITAATIAASITSRPIAVESETRTGDSEETMPIPVPRQPQRPSLASRKSTDSFIQGSRVRLSMAHPPPPPPPTIPPPAIPKHDGLSCPNAALAALSARGRRSRTSAFLADRRSVSLDHLMDKTGSERKNMVWRERPSEDGGEEAPRWDSVSSLSSGMTSPRIRANSSPHFDFTPGAVNRCPRTNKIIPLPTSPPPPPALPPVPNPKSSRRLSHQRTENINLVNFSSGNSNNYWGGGGISPLSSISSPPMSPSLSGVGPVSPPLSPLTVQIPRSISRSFLRPESLTVTVSHPVIAARSSSANAVGAGADAGAASHLPIPTRVVKQQQQHQQLHQLQLQQLDLQMQRDRRWRSQSEPQQQQVTSPKETHRIVMPPSSSLFPSIPSPPVPQSYLLLRRPSQVLQEQAAAAAAAAQAAVNAQSNASYFSHSNDPFRMPRNGGGATPSPVFNKGRRPSATIMTSTITPGVGRMSSESYLSSTGTAHLKQRRSLSLDSAAAAIASSSAYVDATLTPASASPCCDGTSATQSQQNHERPLVVSSTSGSSTVKTADQELRAIIADAIAIAAAKSAAIEAARQSTWYRQNQHRYQQMYHQQAELLGSPSTFSSLSSPTSGPVNTSSGAGTSRPWTPNEDPWGGAPTNSTSSSRSASPFHSGGSST